MLTRRTFLGSTALAGLGLASAACSSARAPMRIGHGRAARPLDSKLRLGVVGVGNRGWSNLEGVGGEIVAALCDVDARYLAKAAERHPDAKQFRDFRRMLTECDLDGVVISTPDHTHFPAACMALQRGLDVYCEKPLTHTVAQARRLNELAAERGLITQMGTQIHSWPNYRRVVEIVRSGMLGEVKEVHVFVNGVDWSARELPAAAPVPEYLDWDLWLGPAAEREFAADFHPMGWRRY
jgi:predicted dehydrogenase